VILANKVKAQGLKISEAFKKGGVHVEKVELFRDSLSGSYDF
jgi:hypothetical protein